MEINLKQLSTQATEATSGVKKMRLSENATSMVFQLFTKNIYSNPIGTVVREITSNCFDSHVEAKVNSPVIIRKFKDPQTDTLYISFIDFGVGMSPDRVENIYGVYFESTKRCDNTQIGGFGIGGKTPLAYKRSTGHGEGEYDNSFYVITNFNGTRYYYCIYEGQEAPEISLLHSESTVERNGTEIRIPVLEKDMNSFAKEMLRQLYYFENIVFEGFENDYNGETLSNQYQIIRGKNFLYRGTEYSSQMHVCLGRVAYPIDYNVLGLSSSDYYMPIALKLEVGEIGVVASREQLDYSENTIKVLKKKLEAVKEEVKQLLVNQYSNIVGLKDYFSLKHNFGVLEFKNGMKLKVGGVIKQSDVDLSNFRYSFMKMPNDKQLFRFFFETKSYGKKPKRSRYATKYEFDGGYEELQRNSNLLYINGEFNRKVIKQAYLNHKYEFYHVINVRNIANNYMRSEIAELFNVHVDKTTDDNGKPVTFVQQLLDMQEEYFDIVRENAQDYDTLEVPEDFIADRKNKKIMSPELRKLTIPIKFVGGYKERISLSKLFDYNMPIFYGTQEDEYKLSRALDLFRELFDRKAVISRVDYNGEFSNKYSNEKNSIMFVMVAQGNIKYFEYCKKAYHISQFYNKMLYRKADFVMNYFQTHGMSEQWSNVNSFYKDVDYTRLNAPKWANKIKEIKTFIDKLPSNKDLGYMKDELSKYFDLTNIKQTDEQKRIVKQIKDVQGLQADNERIIRYIDTPYDVRNAENLFYDILNKVMVL
jgi:hypothetical protein